MLKLRMARFSHRNRCLGLSGLAERTDAVLPCPSYRPARLTNRAPMSAKLAGRLLTTLYAGQPLPGRMDKIINHHPAHRFQALCAQLVDRIVCGVPGWIIEIDQIDGGNSRSV